MKLREGGVDYDELFSAVRSDTRGGAADVLRTALDALRAGVAAAPARDGRELRGQVRALAQALVRAQPAMAPLGALARAALRASEQAEAQALSEARAQVLAEVDAFMARSAAAAREAARHAAALVPAGARLLTVSRSSTVLAALRLAQRPREVVCLEARPGLEGRTLAAELAGAGIPVLLAADAAVAALVARCDLVLVGADAVADAGVVNKIGTHAAALAAAAAGVACYAVADGSKLLEPGVAPALEDGRPAEELWGDAPAGVRVWNHYFEATPLALFRGIVLEDGVLDATALQARRMALSNAQA